MMKLLLENSDSLQYDFEAALGKSAQIIGATGENEFENIQKSFKPGSVVIGEVRQNSSTIIIQIELYVDNNDPTLTEAEIDALMRTKVSNLLYWCNSAIYLIDDDNDIRTRIQLRNHNIPWNIGNELRMATATLEFTQLTPYWEDITETEVTGSGTSIVKTINNSGFLPTPSIISLTASGVTTSAVIYITQNNEGIEIEDLSWGTDSDLYIYKINNIEGKILLGTQEINRNDRIKGGSGFFDFPVGSFTLNIDTDASVSASIKYRKRYYI